MLDTFTLVPPIPLDQVWQAFTTERVKILSDKHIQPWEQVKSVNFYLDALNKYLFDFS